MLTSEMYPIDAGWCFCCAQQMRQAAKIVAQCRRSDVFWSEYLQTKTAAALLSKQSAATADQIRVKDEFEIANLKVEVEPSDYTQTDPDPTVDQKVNDNGDEHHHTSDSDALAAGDDKDTEDNDNDDVGDNKPRRLAVKTTPAKARNRRGDPFVGGQVCHICGLFYGKMDRHLLTAHSELECDMCGRTFNHKVKLRRHFRDDHGFQRYTCEVCQRTNLTRSSWTRHQDMHRPKKDRLFACEHCGNSYPTLHNLRQHVARVHVHKEVTCGECGKAFHNAIRLRDHMIRHRPRTLTCRVPGCPRMFWLVKDQKEHYRTVHEKNRKYVCEVCGKAFLVNAQLKKHHSLGRCRGAAGAAEGGSSSRGRPAQAQMMMQASQLQQEQQLQQIQFGELQHQHQAAYVRDDVS